MKVFTLRMILNSLRCGLYHLWKAVNFINLRAQQTSLRIKYIAVIFKLAAVILLHSKERMHAILLKIQCHTSQWKKTVFVAISIVGIDLCVYLDISKCLFNWDSFDSFDKFNEGYDKYLLYKSLSKVWVLNHWLGLTNVCRVVNSSGQVTHICISKLTIIGSDNGLLPHQFQVIIWINAGLLSIGPLGTNFSETLVKM